MYLPRLFLLLGICALSKSTHLPEKRLSACGPETLPRIGGPRCSFLGNSSTLESTTRKLIHKRLGQDASFCGGAPLFSSGLIADPLAAPSNLAWENSDAVLAQSVTLSDVILSLVRFVNIIDATAFGSITDPALVFPGAGIEWRIYSDLSTIAFSGIACATALNDLGEVAVGIHAVEVTFQMCTPVFVSGGGYSFGLLWTVAAPNTNALLTTDTLSSSFLFNNLANDPLVQYIDGSVPSTESTLFLELCGSFQIPTE